MLVPSIFENNFTDNFFDDMFRFPFDHMSNSDVSSMSTDVQEFDDRYQMELELPGYTKEDISAELRDGYLTVSAAHSDNKDEKDNNGKYIRKERYYGTCQRSFYVGHDITEEDIHAAFKDGVLQVTILKKEEQPKVEEHHTIAIDG